VRHRAGQREDAGADDAADADRGQLPQPEGALEATLGALVGDVVDGQSPEDLRAAGLG
jgi:hypothetical protein